MSKYERPLVQFLAPSSGPKDSHCEGGAGGQLLALCCPPFRGDYRGVERNGLPTSSPGCGRRPPPSLQPGHEPISDRPRLDESDYVYFARTVSAARFSRSKRLASRSKCSTWAPTCVQPWTKYTHPPSTLTLREAACASA